MATLGFSAVLFDIDGTLLDSNSAHADAWFHALREHGFHVPLARIRPLIGMGSDKFLPAVANVDAESAQGKAMVARKRDLFMELLPRLMPTRGARELLEYLHPKVTLAIATSADEEEVTGLLERSGVADLISHRSSKDDDSRSKPDPDVVVNALRGTGRQPREALLIGDTPYDIEAASRAGVTVIALRCGGYWSDESLSDAMAIFDDPGDLLEHWQGSRARTGT